MTDSKTSASGAATREQIRTFHLTGRGLDDALPFEGLSPCGLEEFDRRMAEAEVAWPMFVAPGEAARPFLDILRPVLTTEQPPFPAASQQIETIASMFGAASAEVGVAPVAGVVTRAMELLAARNAVLPAASEQMDRDLRRLPASLPDEGLLIPFSAKALPWLHAAAIAETHGAIRKAHRDSLKQCRDRLRELLALDENNSAAARSPEHLAASLGGGAGVYFNAAVLSAALQRPVQASKPMDAARRARCQQAIAVLDDAWRQSLEEPAFWVFAKPGTSENPFTGKAIEASDPCDAALTFGDERLLRAVPVFRALRIAKLELADAYVPAIHDPILDRFGWETADDDELRALPPIVVQVTAESLAGPAMASFARLLQSGRPVQVLTTRGPLGADDVKSRPAQVVNLVLALREAFVLQSSLAEPAHLLAGLSEMARSLRPAVAVIAVPDAADGGRAFSACALLHETHFFPLLGYDPERSNLWSARIALGPVKSGAITPAHAAARTAGLRHCFRLISESASDAEQVELGEYLKAYDRRPPLSIPYLSVKDEKGAQRRAILTRALVELCRDASRSQSLLEQMANPPQAPAPPCPPAVVDPKLLAAARHEGATQAIHKVVSILMEAS